MGGSERRNIFNQWRRDLSVSPTELYDRFGRVIGRGDLIMIPGEAPVIWQVAEVKVDLTPRADGPPNVTMLKLTLMATRVHLATGRSTDSAIPQGGRLHRDRIVQTGAGGWKAGGVVRLAIVTATTDPDRSARVRHYWPFCFPDPLDVYTVYNGIVGTGGGWQRGPDMYSGRRFSYYSEEILGVVPAFAIGVQKALEKGADIIACLHDDLEIYDHAAGDTILRFFEEHPKCGLVGFGGGTGLGAADIYQTPYNPMQLARQDFVSNMKDAEAHGRRGLVAERVACLDGFSQIGRREFWLHQGRSGAYAAGDPFVVAGLTSNGHGGTVNNLFDLMQEWGVVHHFYDGMLGCFAKRLGWEVWMLPVACHHFGGQTAVGDPRYQQWARLRQTGLTEGDCGDAGFWKQAHQIGYDQFRDVLPIRLAP